MLWACAVKNQKGKVTTTQNFPTPTMTNTTTRTRGGGNPFSGPAHFFLSVNPLRCDLRHSIYFHKNRYQIVIQMLFHFKAMCARIITCWKITSERQSRSVIGKSYAVAMPLPSMLINQSIHAKKSIRKIPMSEIIFSILFLIVSIFIVALAFDSNG